MCQFQDKMRVKSIKAKLSTVYMRHFIAICHVSARTDPTFFGNDTRAVKGISGGKKAKQDCETVCVLVMMRLCNSSLHTAQLVLILWNCHHGRDYYPRFSQGHCHALSAIKSTYAKNEEKMHHPAKP